nr:hypothetical protein [Tanacetum cinerariifolium]
MELYIQSKDHGRIILNSIKNSPLVWPTIEQEGGTVRLKTYEELFDKEKLQANCDLKATNIVLQGLLPDYQQQPSPPIQHVYSSPPPPNPYGAPHHPQQYPTTYSTTLNHTQPTVPQHAYPPLTIPQQPQAEVPQLDSGLVVLTFLPGDDPIAYMNKAMAFMSAVFSPHYPFTNNQLRSSSNPRNQAIVQDGRLTIQQVQGRQGQNVVGSGSQGNASGS